MTIPKFQLDMTKIPAELQQCVRAQVKIILEKNGFILDPLIPDTFSKNVILVGFHGNNLLTYHSKEYNYNGLGGVFYDVLRDWDTWTKLKVTKEFEPIILSYKGFYHTEPQKILTTKIEINANKVIFSLPKYEDTGITLNFDLIHKLNEAVLAAEKWNKENKTNES